MSKFDNSDVLPATVARDILNARGLDEVIVLGRRDSDETFHFATWGTTDEHAGNAAIAGSQLAGIIHKMAPSREEAIAVGKKVKDAFIKAIVG